VRKIEKLGNTAERFFYINLEVLCFSKDFYLKSLTKKRSNLDEIRGGRGK
jgi:hypothetical protein